MKTNFLIIIFLFSLAFLVRTKELPLAAFMCPGKNCVDEILSTQLHHICSTLLSDKHAAEYSMLALSDLMRDNYKTSRDIVERLNETMRTMEQLNFKVSQPSIGVLQRIGDTFTLFVSGASFELQGLFFYLFSYLLARLVTTCMKWGCLKRPVIIQKIQYEIFKKFYVEPYSEFTQECFKVTIMSERAKARKFESSKPASSKLSEESRVTPL